LFLSGDGRGNFFSVLGRESGFFVDGDVKGMAELVNRDGSNLVLVAQNADSLQVFANAGENQVMHLEKNDAYAELFYGTGAIERKEFYYGSGYLSQSSRIIKVPKGVSSIKITTFSDKVREIIFTKNKK